jgi:hypothetical protein
MFINVLGETIKVRKIGEGSFAFAYRQGEDVYLKVIKSDYTKEALLDLKGKHFPEIERLGEDEYYIWYKMPYYKDVETSDYRVVEFLKIMFEVNSQVCTTVDRRRYFLNFAKQIEKVELLDLSLRTAISTLFRHYATLPKIPQFDLAEYNLSYDSNRDIILRDIFCP